jgi:hypothetical protein
LALFRRDKKKSFTINDLSYFPLAVIAQGNEFGTSPDVWINLQKRYEQEVARRELGDELRHIRPRAA